MRRSSEIVSDHRAKKLTLACKLCHERKIRCDRNYPCEQCLRCYTKCEPRSRRPRVRDSEQGVWDRLARLERVIGRIGNEIQGQGQDSPLEIELTIEGDEAAPGGQGHRQERDQEQQQEIPVRKDRPSINAIASQYIGSRIWASLAEEVQALRAALEEEHGADTEETIVSKSRIYNPPLDRNNTIDFILCPPGSIYVIAVAGVELAEPLRITLCHVFCENVDRIFKLFHVPTLRALLIQGMPYLGKHCTAPCNIALKATVYFAATVTFSTAQCESLFGRSRAAQIEHFRRMAEVAMTEANLLSTMDLATLQAFVVLIAVSRSQDRSRRCWTLVAVAVRIARAMGLDKESPVHSPFENELRRRLWHQLRLLDVFCSIDRGTSPIIVPLSFTTHLPSMVNDSDFDEHSSTVSETCTQAITDSTLGRLTYDAINTTQQLVMTQTTSLDEGLWRRRMDVASRFCEHTRNNYVRFCDLSNPFHRLIHGVARTMVYSMMLRALRPDQRDDDDIIALQPPRTDDPRVFSIAVGCLRASEEVYTDFDAQRWAWMFWIQWHALAVALAGLCVIRDEKMVQEAWRWVNAAFARYPSGIADAADGMLWTPMKKLYQKARAFQMESVVTTSSELVSSSQEHVSFVPSDMARNGTDSSQNVDDEVLERMMCDAATMNRR